MEVVQFCDGWLKIKCAEAEAGVAYVLNSADTYAFTAGRIYTVVPGDNLWQIADKELGSGSRCADIRVLNGLDFQCHPGRHETADSVTTE
ncbi:MAG: LysM peptidoglycan-binding domain-containing protein [Subdoligranulum sp.]